MSVRDATPEDRPELVRFMAALQDFERALEANRMPGGEIADSHLAALEEWALGHPAGAVLVGEAEGRPAGFLILGIEEDLGTYRPPHTRTFGFISDLWIEPWARGRGLGRALIAEAEARLKAAGIVRVELAAVVGNVAAVELYERVGYRRYEVFLAKDL